MLHQLIFVAIVSCVTAALSGNDSETIKKEALDWHILFLSDIIVEEFQIPPFNDNDIYLNATVTTVFETDKSIPNRMQEILDKSIANYKKVHSKYMDWEDQRFIKENINNKLKRYAEYADFFEKIGTAKTLHEPVRELFNGYRALLVDPAFYKKSDDDRIDAVFDIVEAKLTLNDIKQMTTISTRFKELFSGKVANTYRRYINRNKATPVEQATGTEVRVNGDDNSKHNSFYQWLLATALIHIK